MLKVAMIGIGSINPSHREAWKRIPEAKVVCLCDIRPEQTEGPKREFGCPAYTDFEEMLAKEDFDVLDITLPTFLHPAYALRALNAGKHVITEKPLSLHKEDVATVYAAAEKNGRCFMVAQCVRFWREYLVVKDAFDTGKYGKLMSGHMERLGNKPNNERWENWMCDKARSGLVPFDLHIHDLDFMIYAFGRPMQVSCSRAKDDTQDYLHVLYQYPDFFITAEAAWYNSRYRFRSGFRFQFEHALLEYKDGKMTVYRENNTPVIVGDESDEGKDITEVGANAYLNEIRYFTDCILAGKPCDRIRAQELVDVLEMIEIIDKE